MKNFNTAYFQFKDFTKNNFVKFILQNFKLNTTYSIIVKISFGDHLIFKMFGNQIGLVIKDRFDKIYLNYLYDTIKSRIEITSENYNLNDVIDGIEFLYTTIKTKPELKLKNINKLNIPKDLTSIKKAKSFFNNNILPLTTDISYFGEKLIEEEKIYYIDKINESNINIKDNKSNIKELNILDDLFVFQNKKDKYIIASSKITEIMFVRQVFNANSFLILFKAKDVKLNSNSFVRRINNLILTINENNITTVSILNELKPIEFTYNIKSKTIERDKKYGCFDIETFVDEDNLSKVYALGFITTLDYKPNVYYLPDISQNLDSDALILHCLNKMLIKKYHNYTFYTHNFGKFDCIFIYNCLKRENLKKGFDFYSLNTIIRDDTILKLDIKIKKNKTLNDKNKIKNSKVINYYIKISIVDSLNLLNNSLAKLAKDFKVENNKGYFPHSFVNKQNLNYIGQIPDIKYFNKIDGLEYNNIITNNWDIKNECLKYLTKDLLSHVNVMDEFSKILFENFNCQLTESLTISRLALNIFLKRYLDNKKIPLINKFDIFNFIKTGYFGGITEVYKPHGKDLIYIDVNSLYPYAALNPMPGLNCEYIESLDENGLDLEDLFGFFYAKVKTNEKDYFGLLPVITKEGLTLPLGEFNGVWCSEELKFAKANGYEITVIKGYNFDKTHNVFDNYVHDLYEIKNNSSGSLKMIAKSLLNNLLGRFGLSITKPITKAVNKENRDYIASTRKLVSQKIITDNDFLITFDPLLSMDICEHHGLDFNKVLKKEFKNNLENKIETFKDVSIAISAFTTSYARIFMNKIKLDIIKKGGQIYYTDTDSLVLDKNYIDSSLIGNKLGQFKLEYDIKEAYFISNKTYCLVLNNNENKNNIIIKAKGINNNSITLNDFKDMYFNNKNINTEKTSTITNYEKGSVVIQNQNIELNYNSYTKREKLFNTNNLWIDTKPLNLKNEN